MYSLLAFLLFWVDGEFAEYFSGFDVDHRYVEVVDEHFDSGSCEFCSASDVVESSGSSQGDFPVGSDFVIA